MRAKTWLALCLLLFYVFVYVTHVYKNTSLYKFIFCYFCSLLTSNLFGEPCHSANFSVSFCNEMYPYELKRNLSERHEEAHLQTLCSLLVYCGKWKERRNPFKKKQPDLRVSILLNKTGIFACAGKANILFQALKYLKYVNFWFHSWPNKPGWKLASSVERRRRKWYFDFQVCFLFSVK